MYKFNGGVLLFIILICCLLSVFIYVWFLIICRRINRTQGIDISSIYVNIHELPRANNVELVSINNNKIIIVDVVNSEFELGENRLELPIANVI